MHFSDFEYIRKAWNSIPPKYCRQDGKSRWKNTKQLIHAKVKAGISTKPFQSEQYVSFNCLVWCSMPLSTGINFKIRSSAIVPVKWNNASNATRLLLFNTYQRVQDIACIPGLYHCYCFVEFCIAVKTLERKFGFEYRLNLLENFK